MYVDTTRASITARCPHARNCLFSCVMPTRCFSFPLFPFPSWDTVQVTPSGPKDGQMYYMHLSGGSAHDFPQQPGLVSA